MAKISRVLRTLIIPYDIYLIAEQGTLTVHTTTCQLSYRYGYSRRLIISICAKFDRL